jgi:hypothetical protein
MASRVASWRRSRRTAAVLEPPFDFRTIVPNVRARGAAVNRLPARGSARLKGH